LGGGVFEQFALFILGKTLEIALPKQKKSGFGPGVFRNSENDPTSIVIFCPDVYHHIPLLRLSQVHDQYHIILPF